MREWEEGGVACEEMKKEEGAVAVSVAVNAGRRALCRRVACAVALVLVW